MSLAAARVEPAPASGRREHSDPDQLVHWLLSSLKLETTVFHVGEYCGNWRASTAGRALASYHLVLRGHCYVHLAGQAPLELGPRDAIFFLRDRPHFLSAEATAPLLASVPALASAQMQALSNATPGSVGLACGFFRFRGALSEIVIDGLPDYLVVRSDCSALAATRVLFDLILAEADRPPDAPSPLVARLADVFFFYVLRHVARSGEASAGLWALIKKPEFATLVEQILAEPAKDWSVVSMARAVGMSRASFFKHFVAASASPPAQVLLLLRMRIAAQRLQEGENAANAAAFVGYQSCAAFSRAFRRVIGEHPGAYRRATRA